MIELRPHHFLCTIAYEGKGYSKAFVKNYDRIAAKLKESPDTKVRVSFGLDMICSHCPHKNVSLHNCRDQQTIDKIDYAHASILGLHEGEILSFKEAKKKIKKHMSVELFQKACKPCEWQKFGMCERALRELIVNG